CHELAHTSHHNHSADFHAHLQTLDPDARVHARQLKEASALVPAWMFKNADGMPESD
ncbi:MAG: M48 family metallopeptidase, partial [Actinobacteria bacterium]|nr:M48 family metallopeptidase [Actinomycetota bacterium]